MLVYTSIPLSYANTLQFIPMDNGMVGQVKVV